MVALLSELTEERFLALSKERKVQVFSPRRSETENQFEFFSPRCADHRPGRLRWSTRPQALLLRRRLRSPSDVLSCSWPRSRSRACSWARRGAGPRRRIGLGRGEASSASSLRALRLRPLPPRKLQRPPRNPAFASAGTTCPGPEPTTSSMTLMARRRRRSPRARRSPAGGIGGEEEGAAALLLLLPLLLLPLSLRAARRPRRRCRPRAKMPSTSPPSRSCS